MKSFSLNGFRVATTAAAVVLAPLGLWAGEAIQFSNTKSRPDPNQIQKPPNEASRPGFDLQVRGPRDGINSGYQSRRRDPRALRKAQNAEDEKKNWMVLEPGQLDAEDEEKNAFGLKDYDLEKPKKKRDYFFSPPEDKGDRAGGQSGKNRNPPEGVSRDLDQKDSDTKGSTKDDRTVGDHVSKELDLKDLLAPGKANSLAPSEDKTMKLWRDILGSSATSESRAEPAGQREGPVADGFRPAASGSFRAQSSTPSLGFRNDFGTRPAPAASSSGFSGSSSPRPSSPLAPRSPDVGLGRPSAPQATTRVPTPNSTYGGTRPGSAPGPAGSPYGQQPPARRQSSGNFDIPARPGYGGR